MSGAKGRGQACLGAARSLAKNHAADARQGIVSLPRHPGRGGGKGSDVNIRHRGWRAEEAGGQYQAVFAVAPAGRGIGPAVNLNGSGGKINLRSAHTASTAL